jgi:hypothetical protein
MTFREERDHCDTAALEVIDESLGVEVLDSANRELGHVKVHVDLPHVMEVLPHCGCHSASLQPYLNPPEGAGTLIVTVPPTRPSNERNPERRVRRHDALGVVQFTSRRISCILILGGFS